MGIYINPGNSGFAEINDADYIDKTLLIEQVNRTIGTRDKLTCISRPRRFGKSYAARMLAAYYDCSCDSHALFDDKLIAAREDYDLHLNRYNIIYLDISGFISDAKRNHEPLLNVPNKIVDALKRELTALDPEAAAGDDASFNNILIRIAEKEGGKRFIFIIDEWDSMIREAREDDAAQESYLYLLRSWFKNANFTPRAVAAAYMTGILPIKKDSSQSAISDFNEYTMLDPGPFADFYGFTEEEVRRICSEKGVSFEKAKEWYDGYTVGPIPSLYNPYSVMKAAQNQKFQSYWKKTSAAEALMTYIDMDQDGLQKDVAALISGQSIEVDTDSFQNDFESFTCKDDVLTLLIHLGYLTYAEEEDAGFATIPNEEIRVEFRKILRKTKHRQLIELVRKSDQLLQDTLAGNSQAVAKAVQEVHESAFAPTFYNEEQALRYTVKMAYISCVDQYAKVEELPSGHGIADTVFLPKKRSSLPALVIELKWDKSAEGAIRQLKDRNYQNIPFRLGDRVLLIGINYDRKTKKHTCSIESL